MEGGKFSVSSWQIQVIKFKLAGGSGSAVAVFQSNDVIFPKIIPDLDFNELHQFLSLVGQGVFFLQRNVD